MKYHNHTSWCTPVAFAAYVYNHHTPNSSPPPTGPAAQPPLWPWEAAAPGSYATGARFRFAAPLGTPVSWGMMEFWHKMKFQTFQKRGYKPNHDI